MSESVKSWQRILRLGHVSVRGTLCKWAPSTCQTFLSKTFANSLTMQKQCKKQNVREKSNDQYSLSIREQTTINHISICFFSHNISVKERELNWREQRDMGSYRQWQISLTASVHFVCRELFITHNTKILIQIVLWTQIRNKNSLTMQI